MTSIEATNAAIDQLDANLDDLETVLEPLLARPLEETLASLPGPLERAKVLFWVAFTIHSCSWLYAKTQAVEVDNHGVLDELNRIKPYNAKITAAMSKETNPSEDQARSMKLDKEGASRFIRAAISNQPVAPSASSSFYNAKGTVTDPLDGPGKHSRLVSLAKSSERAASHEANAESSSEEDDLQVFDGAEGELTSGAPSLSKKGKKRKWTAEEAESTPEATSQMASARSTPKLDPLSGYDNPEAQTRKDKKRAKKERQRALKAQQGVSTAESSANPSPAASEAGDTIGRGDMSEKRKKKKKNSKAKEV